MIGLDLYKQNIFTFHSRADFITVDSQKAVQFLSVFFDGQQAASGFCFRLAAFDTEEENIKQNQQVPLTLESLLPCCPLKMRLRHYPVHVQIAIDLSAKEIFCRGYEYCMRAPDSFIQLSTERILASRFISQNTMLTAFWFLSRKNTSLCKE